MKKLIVTVALACLSAATFAKDGLKTNRGANAHMRATGGFVVKDDPGNGKLLIVNAQKKVDDVYLRQATGILRYQVKINAERIVSAPEIAAKPNAAAVKKLGGTLAVFVKDDAACDVTVLAAPDARWAVVNVATLNADNPGDEILGSRVKKAVLRATALICGGGSSQYSMSLVGAFRDPVKDYDRFAKAGLPGDTYGKMAEYLMTLGMRPINRTTYINACQEGWAPAPTNDIQKAIWDKVHALPTAPLKIKPETKKVAE